MTDDPAARIEELAAKLAALEGRADEKLAALENQIKSRINHAMASETWRVRKQALVFFSISAVFFLGALALAGLAFLRARPAWVQDTTRAHRFELVGKDGKTRVVIEEDAKGEPGLAVLDKDGRRRLSLRVGEKGQAKAALCGPDEREHLQLLLNEGGEPCINLCDREGRARIGMIVEQQRANASYVLLTDPAGKIVWKAP
ncbi:MAG: hypothetical protein HYY17_09725 [Planctomycetes bacterium]|nr:hypothetical protein [Planctomycetota bacterium]